MLSKLSSYSLCTLIVCTLSAHSGATPHHIPSASAASDELSVREKRYGRAVDQVYVDGLGREVSLRGFNVSGAVKLKEFDFHPFDNKDDAQLSFSAMRKLAGSNVVRYTISWEGVQPTPGNIDYQYLDRAITYMKTAIDHGIYVLVDYHSDLYSRHTFTKNSNATGNGAPKWAVPPVNGTDGCGIPCMVTWSAHKLSDPAVRNAMKSFWYDHWIMDKDISNLELYLPASNSCADIYGNRTSNHTPIISWPCHGHSNQRWSYRRDGTLRSAKDNNTCIDVSGAVTWDNNRVQIYSCNGTRAQQFIIDKKGHLHSALDYNKCVVNHYGRMVINECKLGQRNQQFVLRDASTGVNVGESLTYSQSEFVWQMGQVAKYIKANMTDTEYAYILGYEPLNEPFDGGVGRMSYKAFDNQLLWPFYERVRAELDKVNVNKPVYAEPMVFWSSIVGPIAPATGGQYLDYQPGNGFIFTPHFYDQARLGISDFSIARNGSHFNNLDLIRDESRYLNLATFVSEFGMPIKGKGRSDTQRVINGVYQGLESSDRFSGKDRYVDFYTPLISGAQWQWDIYYDNHFVYQNDNPKKLVTKKDAWNNEDFSVVQYQAKRYNVKAELVERAYPRAVQGEVMHFAYEGLVPDADDNVMAYHSIRTDLSGQFIGREFFRERKFAFLAWRGRTSDAPTELFIPRHMNANNITVVTDAGVYKHMRVNAPLSQQANEVAVVSDTSSSDGGHAVFIWDDVDAHESEGSYHFALVIDGDANLSDQQLSELQASLVYTVNNETSPVYLTHRMTKGGYPDDLGR